MPPLEKPSDTPEEQISSLNAGRTRYSDNVSGTPGTDATTQSKAEAADEAWVAHQQRRSRLKASLYQIGMTLAIFAGLGLVVAGLLFLRQRLGGNQGMANIPVINSLSLTNGAGKGSSAATNPSQLAINGDVRINGILSLTPQAISNLAGNLSSKVDLQPSFPGVAQNGNIIVSGIVSASSFQGGGAGLSSLNASALASGTVSNDRLDPSVTRLGQTIPLSSLQTSVIASINNIVSNGGNVDIISGSGITVITDPVTKTITLNSTSGGDITGVMAGTGLLGGGLSGDVTLDIDTGLVTVQGNTFNLPGKLVQLDGAGNLPALNGSALTNLNATSLSSGTLADARLSAGVTLQGNAFNGVNQLVQLNGAGELPVLSALNLTNLNASQILTGTVSDARLSSNVTFAGNTFNLPGKLVQLDGAGNLPALNGSAVTGLNATNIASGTVADARLSANVALLSANQTFSGNVSFAQPLSVNTIQPSSTMTIGALDQTLVLQGDLSTKLTAHSGANSVSLGFTGAPTGTIQYSLDASAPAGSYQLCTTIGNCAGSGGGVTTVGGSTNKLAKFIGAQAVADSSITDTGSLVTVGAATLFKPSADSISAMQVQNAAGSATALAVNTTSNRVAVGQATAGYTLDVAGDINSSTGLRVAGNLVCDATGCAASSGSGFYVRNGTTLQTDTNFNIESTSTAAVVGVVKGKAGQIADLFQAKNGSGSVVAAIDKDGNINTAGQLRVNGAQISSSNLSNDSNLAKLNASQAFAGANTFTGITKIQPATDSTSAFQVQNSAGTSNLLVADTVNTRLGVGTATPGYTVDVNGDVNIANGGSYRINGVSICGPSSTCAPSAGSNNYVQNGLIKQANTNFNIQTISSGSVVGILQGASGQTADILQARDSSNAVLAKITASGQIFQGANQVCDVSNNCNYALGSGSGSYIQNGVGTQVANFNIKSASASSVGAVIQGAVGQTANLQEWLDSSGVVRASLSNLNNGGNQVLTLGSMETTSNWSMINLRGSYNNGNTLLSINSGGSNPSIIGSGASNSLILGSVSGLHFCSSSNCSTAFGYINPQGQWKVGASGPVTSQLDVNVGSSARIGMIISGASGQTANLQEWRNSAGTVLNRVASSGALQLGFNVAIQGEYSGGGNFVDLIKRGGGNSVFVGNTTSDTYVQGGTYTFISNSSGNGISLYSNGVTRYGSTGTLGTSATPWNQLWLQSASASSVLQTIKGANFQTADLLQIQDANSVNMLTVGATGSALFKNNTNSTAAFQIQNAAGTSLMSADTSNGSIRLNAGSASSVAAIIQGAAGQTANLQEWRDSGNNVLAKITSSGQIYQGANQVCDTSNNCNFAAGSGSSNYIQNGTSQQTANFNIKSASASSVGAVIQGAVGQTAALFSLKDSSGANLVSINNTGDQLTLGGIYTITVNSGNYIFNSNSIRVPSIRQDTGTLAAVDATALLTWSNVASGAAIKVSSSSSSQRGLIIQGSSGQTADLLQIQDSAAVNMLSVGATGNVLFKNTANSTTAFQVQDASGANLLIADTVNKRICISTCASMSQSIKLESDGVTFGNGSGNVTAKITQQGNGPLLIGAGSSGNFNGVSIAGAGVGASLTVRGSAITPTDILRIQASSGNDVLNINTTGAVLAKNSANSTAAFQIQNASGARVLNVNTNVNPSPNAWLATTSLPATRESHGSVAYNGYLYAVGGYSGGILGDVQFAPINNNSTIGSWSATSGLSARYSHQTVAYNGYMYALGGYNGGSLSSVQYSAIGGNGTLGSWSNTTGLTVSRYALSAVAYNGYMYALGGVNGTTPQSGVQYAPINANGTLGSWTNTTAMPTTRSGAATVIANGYIYMVGGTGDPTSVIYAPINSDGSLGVWTSTTALPSARQSVSAVVNNNSLYVMGGYDTSNNTTNSVVSIPLNMDGTLGTSWTIRPNISSARAYAGSAAYKGTIYLTGGNGTYNSTQPKSDVQYLPLGTFLYDNSITLNGLLSNTGPAQFRNDTDSTTAFAIQNATATSIFQVDTQNSRVGVGNASPGNLLSVGALTTADSAGQLAVGTGGTSNKGIVIQGVSGQTADLLQAQDSTGAVLAKIDNAGNLTVKSVTLAGHIISGGGTPTIAANTGAGTSPTITVSGTDTSGTITLTTGTSVAPSADVLTLTFATAFAQAPNVVFSPASAGAATLSGNSAVFVTAGTGSFKFSVGSAGLVDSTQYKWTYHVIQ